MSDEGLGVLQFIANSVHTRAMNYRERASHLRGMAEAESVGRLREKLIELAEQFETLADTLMVPRHA